MPYSSPEKCNAHHRARYADPIKRELKLAGQREAYAAKSLAARKARLLKKFGISLLDYDALLVKQGYCCAVCGCEDWAAGGRWGGFHVDHCHETGAVRGLLCMACNTGIGKLQDDPALLDRAAAYLRSHK